MGTLHRALAVSLTGAAVVLAGCGSGGAALEGSVPGLAPAATDVMAQPPYEHASWAIKVTDVATGESLVDYRSGEFLEPGSVTKAYSVGAAWLEFGPDSRITTPVVRTGPIRAGVLRGDLVLVAKGDITMGGQTGPDGKVVFTDMDHNDANAVPGATIAGNDPLAGLDDLARQVRNAGVRRVAGDVVIDDRLFETFDFGEVDGPVSPIVVNNNLIDLVTTPGQPGQLAESTLRPRVAPWRVDGQVRTVAAGQGTEIAIDADETGVITVSGTIAADSAPVLKVWHLGDPATFAQTAFVEALQRAGVDVGSRPVRQNTTAGLGTQAAVEQLPRVAALQSLPFEQHATYILKVSYNRGAQTQVCLLAVAAGSRECDAGLERMAQILSRAGIDPKSAALVDGSGQVGNVVTAGSIVQLMSVMAGRPDGDRWQATLPVLGVDGSLASVQTDSPAKGQVVAKTGTNMAGDLMNQRLRMVTKALGGYMTAKSGRHVAFAIIVNQGTYADLDGFFAASEDLGEIATAIWESS